MTELEIIFWHWWIFAIVILTMELLAPAFFFIWIALSGFIVGAVLFIFPSINLEAQLFLFALLSITSIFLWRYFRINYQPESDQPLLNKRSAQFIGRIFPLYEAIENRRGKIKVDDSIWTVQGQDSPLESKVEVIAVKGMILKVKLVDED